jgi:steroid delta-isomerase-like uncharacterized protein
MHGGLTREQVVAMFQRRDRAYEEHDADTLVADYSEDVEIVSPSAGTHVGRKAAREALQRIFEALDADVETRELLIDGDRVAWRARMEGANLASLLGLPPTGKLFEVDVAVFYELRSGHIVREHRIYDFTGMLLKIGALKVKPV